MDHHLEAVANRALIQTKAQERRDLRDVLDDYAPGPRAVARRAAGADAVIPEFAVANIRGPMHLSACSRIFASLCAAKARRMFARESSL